MFNTTRTIVLSLVALGSSFIAGSARGQEMPNWGQGMADMAQANANFDRQFDINARLAAQYIAAHMQPGEQLPFNAMTISKSISEGNNAMLGYVDNGINNSNIACNAVERTGVGGMQGNWYYAPQGAGRCDPNFVLPYTTGPGQYYMQNGYIYPGYQQGGQNLYPVYGYGR